ncbi:hypothetical protein ACLOJK_012562 [Asimina triloba]
MGTPIALIRVERNLLHATPPCLQRRCHVPQKDPTDHLMGHAMGKMMRSKVRWEKDRAEPTDVTQMGG